MAKLVGICRDANKPSCVRKRQLPVDIDEMRTMVAEFDEPCSEATGELTRASSRMSVKQFCQKLSSLDPEELMFALSVDYDQFVAFLSQFIPCVGCRRCVEKLFLDLATKGYPTVEPFVVTETCLLTINRSLFGDYKRLYHLLVEDYAKVQSTLGNLSRCKKNKRCPLHSLEIHSCRPKTCWSWEDVWDKMTSDCQEECCIVEADSLLDMLETYLQKHRFCPDCKNKLMRAYSCLIGDVDVQTEKGYNARLFQGLRYCEEEAHLHLKASVPYLNSLMERAETELAGNARERHAKTLEVGQMEVLTCLGLYMHGRLHRINTALRTLDTSYQLLYATAVMALFANFQAVLEAKEGLSDSFEKLCQELQSSAANPKTPSLKPKKKKKSKNSDNKSQAGKERKAVVFEEGKGEEEGKEEAGELREESGDAGYSSSREGSPVSTLTNTNSKGPCEQRCAGFRAGCSSCSGHVTRLNNTRPDASQSVFYCCGTSPTPPSESLLQMLEQGAENGEEDGCPPFISQEDIAWFRRNQSRVSREREALRSRIWAQFHQLQARLSAANAASQS